MRPSKEVIAYTTHKVTNVPNKNADQIRYSDRSELSLSKIRMTNLKL